MFIPEPTAPYLVFPLGLPQHACPISSPHPFMSRGQHSSSSSSDTGLPTGVVLRRLPARIGHAGMTIDLFSRDEAGVAPVQWNFVTSGPNTLRGVHVHPRHADYLSVLGGWMLVGLHDMRPGSTTYRLSTILRLRGDVPEAAFIPPGVAHGFYCAAAAEYAYALDSYWDPAGELGCIWNDPALGLDWPTSDPVLSPRDADAPSYAALTAALAEAMTDISRS
jgi:dTDP-4-dehydrorhamnose 3,5-epimerase